MNTTKDFIATLPAVDMTQQRAQTQSAMRERIQPACMHLLSGFKADSQLLWPDKDREEWFSLGENHEKVLGFGLHQLRKPLAGERT